MFRTGPNRSPQSRKRCYTTFEKNTNYTNPELLCCQEHHGPVKLRVQSGPVHWCLKDDDALTALLPLSYLSSTCFIRQGQLQLHLHYTIIFCHPKLIKDTHDKNSEKKLESPTSPRRNTSLHQGLLIVHIKQNCQMFEKHVLEQLLPYLSNMRIHISHAGPEEASNASPAQPVPGALLCLSESLFTA